MMEGKTDSFGFEMNRTPAAAPTFLLMLYDILEVMKVRINLSESATFYRIPTNPL